VRWNGAPIGGGGNVLEIDPTQLGTLELDGQWVPYIDMHTADGLPSRVSMVNDEYAFQSSMIIFGHSAVLPDRIRELRQAGKRPLVIEHNDRYYVYATPP
jgi:hypothetical protein